MALPEYRPEPFTDWSVEANRKAMQEALKGVVGQLGREIPMVIGGERVRAETRFESRNPSRKGQVVAMIQKGTGAHVDPAVASAQQAFAGWSRVPPDERAALLLRAHEIVRRRRFEIMAWQIYEVGKNWAEADGDVAEAIDHFFYDAHEVVKWGRGKTLTPYPGEIPELRYLPMGVVGVISPWNFPFAIPIGMALGAIAAGNAVVLKPASDAVASIYPFVEVMEEAGLPPGVLNFVSGPGGEVGEGLVGHPGVRMAAFTGSREVGSHLNTVAAQVQPEQRWLKRVIAEMGGKNAAIVDDEADLDDALAACVAAAYGYQGQKCSALSRLVLVDAIHDRFLDRFVERSAALEIGPADENYPVGPVINEGAERKILEYIAVGRGEGMLLAGGGKARDDGYYLQPTVFGDVSPDARIAQEEIFGPVVAVIRARDFDDALRIANHSDYALTGAVFTLNPGKIVRAKDEFFCGNLYINRKNTGAVIGVHPFGGMNMSGTDAKVGGPDYLGNFLYAKAITVKYR